MQKPDAPCAQANGAHHDESFAQHQQSGNGKRGADPPNGKAPSDGRSSKLSAAQADTAYSARDQEQGPSTYGSFADASFHNTERDGPIIKITDYGLEPFMQIRQATVRDSRLSLAARGLLAYLLSLPKGWEPHPKHLCHELSLTDHSWRALMGELRALGYTRLVPIKTGGRRIRAAEWPKWAKPNKSSLPNLRKTEVRKNADYKNERPEKNERKVQVHQNLGKKESIKSKAGASAHGAFSSSAFPEEEAEIVRRFNDRFMPKGAQPLNKSTPEVRRILRHCGWGDYTAFEKAALADHANWRTRFKTRTGEYKRPGFVALWHKYKSVPKCKRRGKYDCYRKKKIKPLKEIADRLLEKINALPKGSKQLAKLRERLDAVTAEIARKTKTTPDVVRAERAARQRDREHEAVKDQPNLLTEVVTALVERFQVKEAA